MWQKNTSIYTFLKFLSLIRKVIFPYNYSFLCNFLSFILLLLREFHEFTNVTLGFESHAVGVRYSACLLYIYIKMILLLWGVFLYYIQYILFESALCILFYMWAQKHLFSEEFGRFMIEWKYYLSRTHMQNH